MASHVNLDALIPREDFDEGPAHPQPSKRKESVSVTDLVSGEFFNAALRKPDFQRETSEWDAPKIVSLIESFLSGDLIPAIILWQSTQNLNFIIDGSHRLSAISAWVNNDYGDGEISKALYEGKIPDEQIEIGEKTRDLVAKKIGTYADHRLAARHPEKVKPEILERSKALGSISIQLQWVGGNSKSAELSFRKINEQGVPINATEKKILKARTKPIGYASRALIKAGRGHNYWQKFPLKAQTDLKELAKEVNELLFHPKLKNPIKTLDLPIAGKLFSAQALPVTWDFIGIVNPQYETEADDLDGAQTVQMLDKCRKVAQQINSNHPGSLGLHPIVYLYSESGRHKPASFYALVDFVMELDQKGKFPKFISVRRKFEELLLSYDYVVQQIVRKHRGAMASYKAIKDFYLLCLGLLSEGKSADEAINDLAVIAFIPFATKPPVELPTNEEREFSADVKSRAFIKAALEGVPKCAVCGGYVHTNSVSVDHRVKREHGGDASAENAQVTHPYCNSARDILTVLPMPSA